MSQSTPVVRKSAALQIVLKVPEQTRYELEQIRIAMKASTLEEMVGRAFKEYLEKRGFAFATDMTSRETLENHGLEASGNVTLFRRGGKKLVVHLPHPIDENWFTTLKAQEKLPNAGRAVWHAIAEAFEQHVKAP